MRRFYPIAGLLLAVGCARVAPAPSAALPPDAIQGAGDPIRSAVAQSSYVFANPAMFAGRPADMARAVANQEYLAVAVPADPRTQIYGATLPGMLANGRAEARTAFGINADAPPQLVIDSLYSASRALRAGDRGAAERALSGPAFAGGTDTLTRLGSAPRLPASNFATSRAAEEISQSRVERRL